MTRSSKTSLKFANPSKQIALQSIISEYSKLTQSIIDTIWTQAGPIPALLPANITNELKQQTWLSARMIQCAAKQASAIVRGTQAKQKKRLFLIAKLKSQGKLKQARKLERLCNAAVTSKPTLDGSLVPMELDRRFIRFDFTPETVAFDSWITITSVGDKKKLVLPFKKTKHIQKLIDKGGIMAPGARITAKNITLMFEFKDKEPQEPHPQEVPKEMIAGLDIGVKSCISVSYSDGSFHQVSEDAHGWSLDKISDKLSRKTKDSGAFHRAQTHRTNFINWSINQVDFHGIRELRIEGIRNLRLRKRVSRKLSHFVYREIFDRLGMKAEEADVLLSEVSPAYTSQRCSVCGWTRRSNRKGKQFKCGKCGFTADADLNASVNIRLDLKPIGKKERLKRLNRTGFYWPVELDRFGAGAYSPCCPGSLE